MARSEGPAAARDHTPPCFAMAAAAAARLPPLLLFSLLLLAASSAAQGQDGPRFRCLGSRVRCQALAGYIAVNDTTYDPIRTLFQVDSPQDLNRFNNVSARVPAGTLVRVPFPCACADGVGVADTRPVYTVVAGDTLYEIAAVKFKGLLDYHQIVAANKNIIKNESLIDIGWSLRIPLPCSCDDVDGAPAVHLAYAVAKGDSLEGIAARLGAFPAATLSRINNISDPMSLREGQVLDVPLRGSTSGANALRPQQLRGLPWSCWTRPLQLVVAAAPLYSAVLLLASM